MGIRTRTNNPTQEELLENPGIFLTEEGEEDDLPF